MARNNYLRRKLYAFPSDFQGRLMVMLGVLRHEVNQLLLAFCFDEPRKRIDFQVIAARFRGLTGFQAELEPYLKLLEKSRLLGMTGFLYKEAEYVLTYAGYDFGRPLATFTIKYSVDNNLSIGDFLGRENLKMGAVVSKRFLTFEKVAEHDEEARRFWQEWCLPVREFLRAPTQPPKEISDSPSVFEEYQARKLYARRLITILKRRAK